MQFVTFDTELKVLQSLETFETISLVLALLSQQTKCAFLRHLCATLSHVILPISKMCHDYNMVRKNLSICT